jgi:hypothetical protein
MSQAISWHGTQEEMSALIASIERYCDCESRPEGMQQSTCAAHRLLLEQRQLDGLLFARRLAPRLSEEEFTGADATPCEL